MKKIIVKSFLTCLLLLSACSPSQGTAVHEISKKKDKYTALADSANEKEQLKEIELLSYAKEVEASLSSPKYQDFTANSRVIVKGSVKKYKDFKSKYAIIEVRSDQDGPNGDEFRYYTPIKKGKFEQTVQLFNGKGDYSVKVSLPSDSAENYYYDLTRFKVKNVNPEVARDVLYTSNALDNGLALDQSLKGFMDKDGSFELKGTVANPDVKQIMVQLKKESESTKIILPVENGVFNKKIPLYYGQGVHDVEVMTPKEGSDNYYYDAANLHVNNLSNQTFEPVSFSKEYKERGFTLESPEVGGEKTDTSYSIKGSIDPNAPGANQTNVVFVTTKKGDDEAMYSIPVINYKFDGTFFLRFGPGEYEVALMAPDHDKSNGFIQHFTGVASFTVENTNLKDQRFTLPSRGIQSDNTKIKSLAEQLTKGKTTQKEKALSIYDYVAKNVSYDVDKLNNRSFEFDDSAVKTLQEKKGVCQDFAYLTIALLRASGMEARMVTGFAGQNHAWVETKVDGRWLTMDPTWGSGYLENNRFVPKYTLEYFDPNPTEFQKTHTKQEIEY